MPLLYIIAIVIISVSLHYYGSKQEKSLIQSETIYNYTLKKTWLDYSLLVYFIHPCTNLPLYFERWRFNIISVSGVASQSRTSGCLGDFWTLLAQCCWRGVVFSEKAFQHSGHPARYSGSSVQRWVAFFPTVYIIMSVWYLRTYIATHIYIIILYYITVFWNFGISTLTMCHYNIIYS